MSSRSFAVNVDVGSQDEQRVRRTIAQDRFWRFERIELLPGPHLGLKIWVKSMNPEDAARCANARLRYLFGANTQIRAHAAEHQDDEARLETCGKCGWSLSNLPQNHRCKPKAGKIADALAALMPGIHSTKLGYGDGNITFEISEHRSITLAIGDDGTFSVEKIFWINELDQAGARRLVEKLAEAAGGRTYGEALAEAAEDGDR